MTIHLSIILFVPLLTGLVGLFLPRDGVRWAALIGSLIVLAYVVEGAVVTRVSGQGPERVYKAGEMFYEQPGATHEVSRNASQTDPAKLLAMIFAPKGATLTTQVKQ